MPRNQVSENLLSIADISRHFELPESTTRYYLKRFGAYIPSVGEGRRRRFRPETLEVISAVLDEMKQSRTAQAVEEALAQRFARNAVVQSPGGDAALTGTVSASAQSIVPQVMIGMMERQTQALEMIAQTFPLLLERLQPASTPAECVAALPQESADTIALRREVENLRILLDASEKNQQADLEQLRTWMGRVIQRRDVEVS